MDGNYVIVPATFLSNTEAEFILRIFSEEKNQSRRNKALIFDPFFTMY
jgi:hypothetical protein